jgi:hypothetical protein
VTGVQRDSRGRVTGICGHDRAGAPIDLRGRYVIGADGLRSRVARSAGAAISQSRPAGGAAQYAYYAGGRWAGMELSVAERSFAGVFPTPPRAGMHLGLHALRRRQGGPPPGGIARRGLRRAVRARCPAAGRSAAPRPPNLTGAGHAPPAQSGAPVVRPGLGAGRRCRLSPDAITAYGISDALRDAEFLAVALDQALSAGAEDITALALYQQQRDHALREIFEITCRLAAYPAMPAFIEL